MEFNYDHLLIQLGVTTGAIIFFGGMVWRTWIHPEREKRAELTIWRTEMTIAVASLKEWKAEHSEIVNNRFSGIKAEVAEVKTAVQALAIGQEGIRTLLQALLDQKKT